LKKLFAIALTLAFCAATYAGLDDPGLSIYYSFDDVKNDVVKDGSKYKNDGEIVGGAKFNDGKVGKAIELSSTFPQPEPMPWGM